MKLALFTVLILVTLPSAFAQTDSSTLRSKYGAPLDRETFTVRPGIEMIVNYGLNRQACRLQLPSGDLYGGAAPADVVTKQQIDEVLEEVVPAQTRGKEVNRMLMSSGMNELSVVSYEKVSISEWKAGGVGKGITIIFKDSGCPMGANR